MHTLVSVASVYIVFLSTAFGGLPVRAICNSTQGFEQICVLQKLAGISGCQALSLARKTWGIQTVAQAQFPKTKLRLYKEV